MERRDLKKTGMKVGTTTENIQNEKSPNRNERRDYTVTFAVTE
jgi:hypothetical protein